MVFRGAEAPFLVVILSIFISFNIEEGNEHIKDFKSTTYMLSLVKTWNY